MKISLTRLCWALRWLAATSNSYVRKTCSFNLQLTGGLRGHIARDYFRENNFGFGISHKFEAAGGSFFDQIIGSVEVKYVPDRVFTPIDLAPERDEFIEEDEVEAAVVFTNFYRVSEKLPSAFLVLQYLYRSESDLFGRHLSGYGGAQDRFPGNTNFADDIINENDPGATNIGRSNYQAVAFAEPVNNSV